MRQKIETLVSSRVKLLKSLSALSHLGLGTSIGANDANFVMVPILDKAGSGNPDNARALKVYKTLAEENGVVVRFRGGEIGCDGCLRITVGSEEEVAVVLRTLKTILEVM
jgi:histidinol-phosphate aminotransferase